MSSVSDINVRRTEREAIAKLTAEFLARGGKIEVLPNEEVCCGKREPRPVNAFVGER